MKSYLSTVFIAAAVLSIAACASAPETIAKAASTLEPASGSEVRGVVSFMERADGRTEIRVDLQNVPPGVHGFHIHEVGDCSAPDATSAGGHFNPLDAPHAGPATSRHHLGDLGNVEARQNGVVSTTVWSDDLTVTEGERSVVGRAVVLHAEPDDLTTQPTGAAGARIACGVISEVPVGN